MANYSIIVDSKFQPFSFERYIQPYQIYGQAYKEIENALGELDTKASIWDKMANAQTDERAYKMYKDYADSLKEKRDQLYLNGLNASSRKGLLDMKSRYSKEITPIENAFAARAKEAESQYAGKAQGLVYEGDASTSSLDRYLDNPSIKYKYANSQEGFKRVAATAGALSKQLINGIKKGEALDNFTKIWLEEHGYKDSDVASAISDIQKIINGDTNIETNGVLRNILMDEMKASGTMDWDNPNAVTEYFNKVAPALYQAVGQTQVHTYEDYGKKLAAQEAKERRMAELQYEISQRDKNNGNGNYNNSGNGFALNPSNIYSKKELEKIKKDITNYKDKYFKVDKNGKLHLTQNGWKEYFRKDKQIVGYSKDFPVYDETPSSFNKFMNKIGAGAAITNRSFGPNQAINAGRIFEHYMNNSKNNLKYDATKHSELVIDVPQDESYQKQFKAKLSSRISNTDPYLYEVDYDNKTGQWVMTNNKLSYEDFSNPEYKIVSKNPGSVADGKGNYTTWMIQKDKEPAKRYMSIPGMHSTAESGRNEATIQKQLIQNILKENPNLSDVQRAKLNKYYDNLSQQVLMFEMQGDVVNNASNQDVKPYYIP